MNIGPIARITIFVSVLFMGFWWFGAERDPTLVITNASLETQGQIVNEEQKVLIKEQSQAVDFCFQVYQSAMLISLDHQFGANRSRLIAKHFRNTDSDALRKVKVQLIKSVAFQKRHKNAEGRNAAVTGFASGVELACKQNET